MPSFGTPGPIDGNINKRTNEILQVGRTHLNSEVEKDRIGDGVKRILKAHTPLGDEADPMANVPRLLPEQYTPSMSAENRGRLMDSVASGQSGPMIDRKKAGLFGALALLGAGGAALAGQDSVGQAIATGVSRGSADVVGEMDRRVREERAGFMNQLQREQDRLELEADRDFRTRQGIASEDRADERNEKNFNRGLRAAAKQTEETREYNAGILEEQREFNEEQDNIQQGRAAKTARLLHERNLKRDQLRPRTGSVALTEDQKWDLKIDEQILDLEIEESEIAVDSRGIVTYPKKYEFKKGDLVKAALARKRETLNKARRGGVAAPAPAGGSAVGSPRSGTTRFGPRVGSPLAAPQMTDFATYEEFLEALEEYRSK